MSAEAGLLAITGPELHRMGIAEAISRIKERVKTGPANLTYDIDIVETAKFPDHHKYSDQELRNLNSKVKENNNILLTTEKDYLRINESLKKNINYLKIETEIEKKNQFIDEIKKII